MHDERSCSTALSESLIDKPVLQTMNLSHTCWLAGRSFFIKLSGGYPTLYSTARSAGPRRPPAGVVDLGQGRTWGSSLVLQHTESVPPQTDIVRDQATPP